MAINMMIDEKAIEAEEGMTILEAARQNGIHIPTLCYMKELKPQVSCRICIVEIEGARTFQDKYGGTAQEQKADTSDDHGTSSGGLSSLLKNRKQQGRGSGSEVL